MPSETGRRRKEKLRYSVVLIPSGESSRTRNFSFGKLSAALFMTALFLIIAGLVIMIVIYTPLGILLPISHTEIEKKYREEIKNIELQLNSIASEMVVLHAYNIRLRKALGENIPGEDSSRLVQRGTDVQNPAVQSHLNDDTSSRRSRPEWVARSRTQVLSVLEHPLSKVAQNQYTQTGIFDELPMSLPTEGYISRGFNAEQDHFGLDIAGKEGTPVIAAAPGNIVFADWTYDNGFMIIIAHGRGYTTVYKHNKSLLKSSGIFVKRGDMIALLGNTGSASSGPHLHFEVWKDGVVQNPADYLLNLQ